MTIHWYVCVCVRACVRPGCQADVTAITEGHAATMTAVYDAVVANNGFAWPLLTSREASLDLADPRPPAKCMAFMRNGCSGAYDNNTLMFGFTRA